ncbi:tripartite tricarboxylate transporter TctB family protein [Bacillus sp. JJ1521]|uniref:tripartite tricarboxylate transporter TctB family protein n=1 Tax=Bacillus sp. JJ1521 TaxID=3122957 RepID=UPI002FFEF040
MSLNKKSAIFYFTLAVLCFIYFLSAIKIPFGSLSKPLQGFFPVTLSVIGIALCLFNGIRDLVEKSKPNKETGLEESGVEFTDKKAVFKLVSYIGVIILFILLAGILGTFTCIFLLVLVLSKIQGLPGIVKPLFIAIGTAVVFYLVFGLLLEVLLPTGIFI